MQGLTKVKGVGTEEIIQFMNKKLIYYSIRPCHLIVNPRNGYPNYVLESAFKTRIELHPENVRKINSKFRNEEYNHHFTYRAYYKISSFDFLQKQSGLIEIINGLIVVDTVLSGNVYHVK